MPAIEAYGLVKRYVSRKGLFRKTVVTALRGVSFAVERGEVFCLLGPNGAGKTTTVKILSTILVPDEGVARVLGYDVVSEADSVREVIGVSLSVERGYWMVLTGRENLKYFGMLRGLHGKDLEERINHVLELVGLVEAAEKPVEEYSLGMRARLALARALLHDPPVLILDEPTIGLDPPSARHVRSLLRALAKNGKTVFLTTHNMWEAEIVCDRVAFIRDGRIIAVGTPSELKRRFAGNVTIVVEGRGDPATINEVLKSVDAKLAGVDQRDGLVRARFMVEAGSEEAILARLVSGLVTRGFRVVQARVEEITLEDVFIAIAGSGVTRV